MFSNEELEYLSNRSTKKLKQDIDGLDRAISGATDTGEKGEVIRLLINKRKYIENLIREASVKAIQKRINELKEEIIATNYEIEKAEKNTQMTQWYKDSLQVSLYNLRSELRYREQELETADQNDC